MRAMGKPVALEANADDRETRGFISMTAYPAASLGVDRELNVGCHRSATPDRARCNADRAASRRTLVLTVGEGLSGGDRDGLSPVWTPMGSTFSMEQTMIDESTGRVTHDLELELLPTKYRATPPPAPWLVGRDCRGRGGAALREVLRDYAAMPPPLAAEGECSGATMAGRPMASRADPAPRPTAKSTSVCRPRGTGEAGPRSWPDWKSSSRSSASRIDRDRPPPGSWIPKPLEDSFLLELHRQVEGGLSAESRDQRVGSFAFEDPQ